MNRGKLLTQKAGLSPLLTGVFLGLFSCGVTSDLRLKEVTAQDVWKHVTATSEASAVLVNVWATWCEPCIEELPMILDLEEQYSSAELEIQLVSVDWLDQREMARSFLKERGISGVSFIKNQDDNEFINALWSEWTGAVPFTLIYSRNERKVVDFWEGRKSRKHFVSAIEKVLEREQGGA